MKDPLNIQDPTDATKVAIENLKIQLQGLAGCLSDALIVGAIDSRQWMALLEMTCDLWNKFEETFGYPVWFPTGREREG